jgi:ribosomal subunit interface protein
MQRPVQITFHEIEPSAGIEDLVREKVARLEDHNRQIIGCRVSVNNAHRSTARGAHDFEIVVHVELPGDDLHERVSGDDCYGAIREAFRVLQRRMTDELDKRRGEIKSHAAMSRGRMERQLEDEQLEVNDDLGNNARGEGMR